MPVEAIITLVVGALIIAAAALGLIRVILHLRAVATTDDVIKEVANGAVRYAGPVSKLLG